MNGVTNRGLFSSTTRGSPFETEDVQNLNLQNKTDLFERGKKIADNQFLAARILCLSSVIVGIAVAILFSPYMALVAFPLGGCGIYMWSCAYEIREFCSANQEIAQYLTQCFDQALSIGASPDKALEIEEAIGNQDSFLNEFLNQEQKQEKIKQTKSIKKKIEDALKIFQAYEEKIGDIFNSWNLSNLKASDFNNRLKNFSDNRLRCNRAYQDMFTSGSKNAYALSEYSVSIVGIKDDIFELHRLNYNFFEGFLSQYKFKLL